MSGAPEGQMRRACDATFLTVEKVVDAVTDICANDTATIRTSDRLAKRYENTAMHGKTRRT